MTQELNKQTSTGLSLKDRMKQKDSAPTLLLDTSGSMHSECEPGTSRIAALRNIVANIKGSPKIYSFNDICVPCLKNAIPEPCGGTWLSRALQTLLDKNIKKILLLTDGEAQDQFQSLEFVKAHGIAVQVMYIGPGSVPKFLEDLASAAGGSMCTQEDLSKTAELEGKITLLLEAGNMGGPVCL